jgi:hypothetical protein
MNYNRLVMRRLQAAIEYEPEVDITAQLPENYSRRLTEIRYPDYAPPSMCRRTRCIIDTSVAKDYVSSEIPTRRKRAHDEGDIRDSLFSNNPAEIIFPCLRLS